METFSKIRDWSKEVNINQIKLGVYDMVMVEVKVPDINYAQTCEYLERISHQMTSFFYPNPVVVSPSYCKDILEHSISFTIFERGKLE